MKNIKVRMQVGMSGTRSGVAWPAPGEILECSPDEGAQLCASGIAIPVVEDEVETATAVPAEKRDTKSTDAKSTKE